MRVSWKPGTIIVAAVVVATIAVVPFHGLAQPANPQPATHAAGMSREAKPPSPSPLAPVYAKALEGDVREALRILESVPLNALDSKERTAREDLLKTFVKKQLPPIVVQDPFAAEVIGIYREYWMRVLLHEATPAEGQEHLFKRLSVLLKQAGCRTRFRALGTLVEEVKRRLRRKGFYSNVGVVLPYWDLMVWRSETNQNYKVKLPETTVKVKVVFMRGFVSLGWSALATCGRSFSGGWAWKEALYCVADVNDPTRPGFEAHYLAHEAQHYADFRQFPLLEQPEREYRSKLVELILGPENSRAALLGFGSQTSRTRTAPHGFANLRVYTDVSRAIFGGDSPVNYPEGWRGISDQAVSEAAKSLLERNTQSLVACGARRVSRILEDPMP